MNKLKATLVASAVAVALAAPIASHAASTILFDQTGTTNYGTAQTISQFTWAAGNVLMDNMARGTGAPVDIFSGGPGFTLNSYSGGTFLGQAVMGGFVGGSKDADTVRIFTYQFSLPVTGSDTLLNILGTDPGKGNTMDASNTFATPGTFKLFVGTLGGLNTSAGTGYDQTLILSGSAFINPTGGFSLTQNTKDSITAPLGTIGGANLSTPSVNLTGSTSLLVDVGFADTAYFLSDITSLTLAISLAVADADLRQQVGFTAPFDPDNPVNAKVVGVTPGYGADGINNFYCDPAMLVSCDIQTQSSGTTFFNGTPEPSSLALLGLGLGFLGFRLRGRGQKS